MLLLLPCVDLTEKTLSHLKIAPLVQGVWGPEDGHLPVVEVRLLHQSDAEALHRLILQGLQLHHQGLLGTRGWLVGHGDPTSDTDDHKEEEGGKEKKKNSLMTFSGFNLMKAFFFLYYFIARVDCAANTCNVLALFVLAWLWDRWETACTDNSPANKLNHTHTEPKLSQDMWPARLARVSGSARHQALYGREQQSYEKCLPPCPRSVIWIRLVTAALWKLTSPAVHASRAMSWQRNSARSREGFC